MCNHFMLKACQIYTIFQKIKSVAIQLRVRLIAMELIQKNLSICCLNYYRIFESLILI
jgi:hypothetical protein